MSHKSGRNAGVAGGVALLLVGLAACGSGGKGSAAAANDAPAAAATATSAPSDAAAPVTSATKSMFGLRAVHMTADSWAYKPLHDPVVQMLKDHKIDTVELDIKDEDGHVQYKSNVPVFQQDGSE